MTIIPTIKKGLKKITPLYKIYRFIVSRKTNNVDNTEIPDFLTKKSEILDISKAFPKADIFIETGTFLGDTIEFFKNNFKELYSIELSKDLAERATKRFNADHHIKIIQGNSATELKSILAKITSQCIFWLDGHYSTEFWLGDEYIITAKGDKNTPILKELSQIADHSLKDHIILIDDARLFIGKSDYPSIAKLKKFISKKMPLHGFEIKNDIIRILPES